MSFMSTVSVCYLFLQGTMMIRPYCYTIWEAIQDFLNVKFKETSHETFFWLFDFWSIMQFIPYSFIEKEASHVEGFSPELASVTVGGGKELEGKTRGIETIVNHMFTQWIHSHRDHPLMVNQMCTKPFVRTLEFLWQEGHTAHATAEEAKKEAMQMIDIYTKFSYEQAAIPRKSKVETFDGAVRTYTIKAIMGDRKALQAGTSHNLGQNFSRVFGTQFTGENGLRQHVWQTSWAISTRFVGGIIMTHGDDIGLMLPPRMVPLQTYHYRFKTYNYRFKIYHYRFKTYHYRFNITIVKYTYTTTNSQAIDGLFGYIFSLYFETLLKTLKHSLSQRMIQQSLNIKFVMQSNEDSLKILFYHGHVQYVPTPPPQDTGQTLLPFLYPHKMVSGLISSFLVGKHVFTFIYSFLSFYSLNNFLNNF
ncbi:hypothetical protein UlMin_004097 [Ulmus minor]